MCCALAGSRGSYAVPGPVHVVSGSPPPGEIVIWPGTAVTLAHTGPTETSAVTGRHWLAGSQIHSGSPTSPSCPGGGAVTGAGKGGTIHGYRTRF